MLPGRPNGSTGWIERGGTNETQTGWHIVVNLARRRVWVYFHGRLQRTFQAVVGKPSTPTPTGSFFVQETVIMPASEAGGPFALATSARSDVLHNFNGGPGQIGIHGRDGLGGTLGTAGPPRLRSPGHPRDHLAGGTHRTRRARDHPRMTPRRCAITRLLHR